MLLDIIKHGESKLYFIKLIEIDYYFNLQKIYEKEK